MDVAAGSSGRPGGQAFRPSAPYAAVGAMISILMGYDLGVVGAALSSLQGHFQLDDLQVSMLVGSFSLVNVVGSPLAGVFGDLIGRRTMLGLSAAIATVGVLAMASAQTYEMLLLGRMIAGLGSGAGHAVAPVYLCELAPSGDRGFVVAQIEVFLNVGIFFGFLAGLVTVGLGSDLDFRVMFALGALPAIALMVALPLVPESPRWLLSCGREDAARAALSCTVGPQEVEQTMAEMAQEAQAQPVSLQEELGSTSTMQSLVVAAGLAVSFAFTGIDTATYYSTDILQAGGLDVERHRRLVMVLYAAVKTTCIIVAVMHLDRLGRRSLLTASYAGMAVAIFVLMVPGLHFRNTVLTVGGLFCYASCFSLGVGPGFYLVTAEIWPTRLRSKGTALAHCIRGLASCVVQIFFLRAAEFLSYPGAMCIFAMSCAASVLFVQLCVPETMGRSLEEIIGTRRQVLKRLQDSPTEKGLAAGEVFSATSWGLTAGSSDDIAETRPLLIEKREDGSEYGSKG